MTGVFGDQEENANELCKGTTGQGKHIYIYSSLMRTSPLLEGTWP